MKVSVEQLKKELGKDAVLTDGHFLLRSEVDGMQRHSAVYINKDEIYADSLITHHILVCFMHFVCIFKIDSIVGPDSGGNKLSLLLVGKFLSERKEIYSPQTKKTADGNFYISGGEKYIKGKNILLVEDIMTTGGSIKKIQKIIQVMGGNVVGIACIVNRGGVKAENFHLEKEQFFSYYEVDIPDYSTRDCPQEILERPISKKHGARIL